MLYKPSYGQIAAGAFRNHPQYRGCVGHWIMHENGGLTAYDISGYGHNGTLTNMNSATDWVPGQWGPALDFDGANDFILVAMTLPTKGAYSLWFKLGDLLSTYMMLTSVQWTHKGIAFTGTVFFSQQTDFAWTSNTDWHHLVVNFTTSVTPTGVFLDTIALTGVAGSNNVNANQSDLNISGRNSSGSLAFFGKLDDVRIFDHALSAENILALYNDPWAPWRTPRRRVWKAPAAAGSILRQMLQHDHFRGGLAV